MHVERAAAARALHQRVGALPLLEAGVRRKRLALQVGQAGAFAGPWLVAGATGVALQLGAWSWQLRAGRLSSTALAIASAGAIATVLAVVVAREAIRLAALDLDALSAVHARAAGSGGLPLFLLFLVANTALIVWAVRLVRRGLARE